MTTTVERLNDNGTWEVFRTGPDATKYLPMGWGGHNRSERSLEALRQGETIRTPLGTYRIREEG